MTSIPIFNCNSNCSTGANALILAKQLIETGKNDCVLAVGFEKMERGSLGAKVGSKIVSHILIGFYLFISTVSNNNLFQ